MTEEKAVTVKREDAPVEWGTRAEVGALADRLATMLPNAKDLTKNEILTAAQYCRLMDLNPFRGEVYFYKNRGQLCVVDGYKALTRWARNQAPYSERYEQLPVEDGQIVHVRCWIVRDDRRAIIGEYRKMGATFKEAFEMVAVYADGIVTEAESSKREPPAGWDWDQVARKRALKNAINLSHGAPSPREIAELSWQTNGGVQTIPEDWDGAEELGAHEAERLAELNAQHRLTAENWQSLTKEQQAAKVETNSRQLYGDPDFEGFGDEPETTTATTAPDWKESPPEWFEQTRLSRLLWRCPKQVSGHWPLS